MAYWNALLKRLLQQSTLLIDINETDNSVIKMFVHRGSVVVRGNALIGAFEERTDLGFRLLFSRSLSYLLSPPALASVHTVPLVGFWKLRDYYLLCLWCPRAGTHLHITGGVNARRPPG